MFIAFSTLSILFKLEYFKNIRKYNEGIKYIMIQYFGQALDFFFLNI
jgi:hypothetical protein